MNLPGQAKHGAAKAIYDEMPLDELKKMPVGALAHPEGAVLLLWSTACQAADGAHVERYLGNLSPGRYAWSLVNVRPLYAPRPARGQQGLWDWNPTETELDAGQLGEVCP